ncbi:hypothetical protein BDP55DRAFT_7816 [Colletotrichum godetiae]|uniref:Uncharacterized protein n=1 Tax=Colletotrichum godetiae TaxID=1209918 RepID=A0AAJ0F530_9PEZI|nr:uncharacterized protein BDP55DRAFT_7816 [Colletotrichum godetiae]KAK1701043.1 hypothetical protein BDP55DRAFT_7816 [Colletotrichum godetiae]
MLRRRNDESLRCKEGKKGKVPYGVSETSQPPSSDGENTGEKRETHNTSPQYGIPHCEWIGAGTYGRLARTLWTPNEGREMWYSVARKMHNSEFRGTEARLASPCLPSENRWIAAARQGCSSSRPLAFPLKSGQSPSLPLLSDSDRYYAVVQVPMNGQPHTLSRPACAWMVGEAAAPLPQYLIAVILVQVGSG